MPEGEFFVEDLDGLDAGMPPTGFVGEVVEEGETSGHFVLRQKVVMGPMPSGTAAHIFALALWFPHDGGVLVGIVDLPGGYHLSPRGGLEFELAMWVPRG